MAIAHDRKYRGLEGCAQNSTRRIPEQKVSHHSVCLRLLRKTGLGQSGSSRAVESIHGKLGTDSLEWFDFRLQHNDPRTVLTSQVFLTSSCSVLCRRPYRIELPEIRTARLPWKAWNLFRPCGILLLIDFIWSSDSFVRTGTWLRFTKIFRISCAPDVWVVENSRDVTWDKWWARTKLRQGEYRRVISKIRYVYRKRFKNVRSMKWQEMALRGRLLMTSWRMTEHVVRVSVCHLIIKFSNWGCLLDGMLATDLVAD